ncbi:unnamed protein product [Clavelina lepadiformis]|uniref:Uncharacterized protein n=1 Tax=Clavelina lepadiformis TaxID=159417 RepID=A0ABP0GEY8_CLALP
MDCSKHEGGVDTLDENCEEFNCLRKTNRWPMVVNYNFINVASNDAFLIMRSNGKSNKKTDFLKQFSFQLSQPYVMQRKLAGETELLAEKLEFIDAATSSTFNRTVQGQGESNHGAFIDSYWKLDFTSTQFDSSQSTIITGQHDFLCQRFNIDFRLIWGR